MARYFFHLTSSNEIHDDEGAQFDDLDGARCHAVKMIADVLCHAPHEFWGAETYRVTVTDEAHLILFTVEMISIEAAAVKKIHPRALGASSPCSR